MVVEEFLRTGTSLLQALVGHGAGSADLGHFIKQFQYFVTSLNHEATDNTAVGVEGLRKACWKISQDVLIRLKRLRAASESEDLTRDLRSVFTEQDVESLRTQLFGVQMRWQGLRPHTDAPLDIASQLSDTISDSPAGDNELLAESQEQPQSKPGSGRARPAPSKELLQEFILESLSFQSMESREQDVSKAHGNSFDWIFNSAGSRDSASDPMFTEWLSTDNLGSIYWITGKPGSGKSTLMRYLSGHHETKRSLQVWAADKQVAIAGFYFWVSGSEDQRSRVGLLRSLLHQLLSLYPESIPAAFPRLWQKLSGMTSKERIAMGFEWTGPELTSGFLRLLDTVLSQAKVCLFIDGLDELDGDHDSMIRFFRDLGTGKHASQVKMCLSSRPWEVFERAFARSVPNLRLQELILGDMTQYAYDSLNQNVRRALRQNAEEAEGLVQEIVTSADGVFLWARLVVREIIKKFGNAQTTTANIRDYLSSFPTELGDLFGKLVFTDQSEEQLIETSKLFQLVHARETVAEFIKDDSATSLSIWELAFASKTEDDVVALTKSAQEATDDTIVRRCAETQDWVQRSSAGLLDIFPRRSSQGNGTVRGTRFAEDDRIETLARKVAGYKVTYLHRTVRDWLLHPFGNPIWLRLTAAMDNPAAPKSFDPHLYLLRSYVLQMKHPLEEIEHHRRLDEWYPDIALSLTHARHVVNDRQGLQTKLVKELDKTISWYWLTKSSSLEDHWARNRFGTFEERRGDKLSIPFPFLALCTKFGLERYVLDTLDAMANTEHDEDGDASGVAGDAETGLATEETPLLYRALEFLCSRQKTIYPLSSPTLVRSLLAYSQKYSSHAVLGPLIGSPNKEFWTKLLHVKDATPWIMVLRSVRDGRRRGWIRPFDVDHLGTERWTRIIELFVLEGGADREAIVRKDGWDPEANASEVLGRGGMLDIYGDWWIEDRLGRLFEARSRLAKFATSGYLAIYLLPASQVALTSLNMFSKQPKFTPKTLPKPKIRTVSVEVPKKPSTPVNGRHGTSMSSSPRPSASTIVAKGAKKLANSHSRASKSPFTSSDEKGSLAPPTDGRKRIRSPATDSDRVAFDSDGDSAEDDDDDWESRLKRRKMSTRMDPNRKLQHSALAELAANGYKDTGKAPKIVHAADVVSLELGDKPWFPGADPEELVVKLQYPGSLTRERFVLSDAKDKLNVFEDIKKVVENVRDTFLTPEQAKEYGFKDIIRQLERNYSPQILNLAGYKAAIEKYNNAVLHLLKTGAIVAAIDKQHELSEGLIDHILTQVYDRVVTPKVDILKKYDNGTDNVYGEMNRSFVRQALCQELRMTSEQVFVDLGSGVGNVTLQAALEIGCESWGCEMMEGPATLAKAQHAEFRARCKLWGIQPGRVRFVHDDFTKDEAIKDVLQRAEVVLANNFAFTPQLNDTLKIMFLDLKEDCKLVSLKNFVSSSAYHTNDIATQILDVRKYRWPPNGVSWTESQGDYFIATKK
ncbi:hypothetical protein N8I77_007840 [Diaporthe amygdali]|uniref:Histone-lysine N-methyltransferase, H3 lysine-79 specific n=1 Tax=Phomopsis amygdali TaxID=1214568 RepID=A0AAD9SDV5_PHOAM|nr:hypothetical protein N8I77_007840 [Diaporthe amygdali]